MFIYHGIREIFSDLVMSKLPLKRRLFRLFFRIGSIRSYYRSKLDKCYSVSLDNSIHSKNLWTDGFCVKDLSVFKVHFDKLLSIKYKDDFGNVYSNKNEVTTSNLSKGSGRFINKSTHLDNPFIYDIAYSDEIFDIVKEYLGEKAYLADSVCWLSLPSSYPDDHYEFSFHRDIGSWKWLNVFIYLNDVDLSNGPHKCIPKTHNYCHSLSFFERRLSSSRKEKLYGNNHTIFLGNKYTAIFEDTSMYHGASKVKSGYRHILQLNFNNFGEFTL